MDSRGRVGSTFLDAVRSNLAALLGGLIEIKLCFAKHELNTEVRE